MVVYFPNRSTNRPTTCRQLGSITSQTTGSINVSLAQGKCENGKELAHTTLGCTKDPDGSLVCEFGAEAKLPEKYLFSRSPNAAP